MWSLDVSQTYEPPRSVTGTSLPHGHGHISILIVFLLEKLLVLQGGGLVVSSVSDRQESAGRRTPRQVFGVSRFTQLLFVPICVA
jgi:hypothetical protein